MTPRTMLTSASFCPRSHFCSSIFNGLFLSFQHSGIIIFYCHFWVFNQSLEEYRFAWQWTEAACFLKLLAFLKPCLMVSIFAVAFMFLEHFCFSFIKVLLICHLVLRLTLWHLFNAFDVRFSCHLLFQSHFNRFVFLICRFGYAASARLSGPS